VPAEFPWVFEYSDDPVVGTEARWGRAVLRPLVETRLIGPLDSERVFALVDSGTEYSLAMRWIAQAIGAEVDTDSPLHLGMGGENLTVYPAAVTMRFGPTDVDEDDWFEWETEIGVVERWKAQWPAVLGQRGFFDQFTVTMSRHAQLLVITDRDDLEERLRFP